MSSIIAIVKSIVGQVFAMSPEGTRRLLIEGDRLLAGDQVMTGQEGMISLELSDGRILDLGRDSQWTVVNDTPQVAATPSAELSASELQQAITAGLDPTAELEATAAGAGGAAGTGGAAGGGHSFVLLDATAGQLDANVGYNTQDLGFAATGLEEQNALANNGTNATANAPTPVNAPPTIVVTANDFTEDSGVAVGAVAGTYVTADAEGDALTVSFNTASTHYTLGSAGQVLLTQAGLDVINAGGTLDAIDLKVTQDNDASKVGTGSATPVVTAVDDAPTIVVTANDFTEDSGVAVGAVAGTYVTADAEGDALTVSFNTASTHYTLGSAGQVLLTQAGLDVINAGGTLDAIDLKVTQDNDASKVGTGSATPVVTAVNDAPDAVDDGSNTSAGLISGLRGEYFAYHENTADGASIGEVPGQSALDQALAFIANNQPDASFTAGNIAYGQIDGDLGADGKLQSFLGSDAGSLNTDPENSSDAIIKLSGSVYLEAGTYNFQVRADDGYQIKVDGNAVATVSGNQGPTTTTHNSFTVAVSGWHSIEAIYWDQGGQAVFQPSLAVGSSAYQPLSSYQTQSPLVTSEDQSIRIKPDSLLANDTDADGDALSIVSVQNPSHGTVSLVDGSILFTPESNYNGIASFTYTIRDAGGLTDTATVFINVTPVNDPAFINGTATGNVVEAGGVNNAVAGISTASGSLIINDADSGQSSFQTPASLVGTYGSFTFDVATGAWTYTLSNTNAATQSLIAGQVVHDTLTVTSLDGTASKVIDVSLTGSNDNASISGTATGSVTEDGTLTANGNLTVTDVDSGQSLFQTPASLAGTYGTFTFNANTGAWGYTATNSAIQFLAAGKQVFDTLMVTSADGTATQNIQVTINGSNDLPSGADASFTINEDGSKTFSASDFGFSDIDTGDSLSAVRIDSLPTDGLLTLGGTQVTAGQEISSAQLGSLIYTPTANDNHSGQFTFSVKDQNGGFDSSPNTININVTAVADSPNLSLSSSVSTPTANGLNLSTWNNLSLGTNGNGADPATLQSIIDQAGTPSTSSALNNVQQSNVTAGIASKVSGLIYLEAGSTYTFSGIGDDSIRVVVGGTVVTSATWGGSSGVFSGAFTPTESGYYTLAIYHHNQSGPGDYDVNLSVNGGTALDLSSSNYQLYKSTADLSNAGLRLSSLEGSNGSGYYHLYGTNEGEEDSAIPLSSINASLNDTDGSESLSLSISNIPAGAVLRDGAGHTFTASEGLTSVTVTGWSLSTLTLLPPGNFSGTISLIVTATATEASNSDTNSVTTTLNVTVAPVADAPSLLLPNTLVVIAQGSNTISTNRTVSLPITAYLSDSSETLSVSISGLANGSILSDGTNSVTAGANGIASLAGLALANLTLTLPQGISTATATSTLTVTATSTESDGSSSYSQMISLLTDRIDSSAINNRDGNNSDNYITVSNNTARDGGAGNDLMIGDASANTLKGGTGNDVLLGNGGNDTLNGGDGNDRLEGGAGDDTLNGDSGNDMLLGGDGTDNLYGGDGNDYLAGGLGNDTLNGDAGDDILIGDAGNDILLGGTGNDILRGGLDNDTLTGGSGADTFIWLKGDTGNDMITDFRISEGDRIDLRDLLQGETDATMSNFLQIDTASNSLLISSTGQLNVAGGTIASHADVTIKLDGFDFSSTSINSLIAGSDPTIKVDHS